MASLQFAITHWFGLVCAFAGATPPAKQRQRSAVDTAPTRPLDEILKGMATSQQRQRRLLMAIQLRPRWQQSFFGQPLPVRKGNISVLS
jgi:hypothetical protein